MAKKTISKDSQRQARVLSAAAVGSRDQARWIVQEDRDGRPIEWIAGAAQPSLLEESKGYVRPTVHRIVQRAVYEQAPIHRVEIWRAAHELEFHVRIFEQIDRP